MGSQLNAVAHLENLEVVLGEVAVTLEATVRVTYDDFVVVSGAISSGVVPVSTNFTTAGTTAVAVISGPAANSRRASVSVFNADSIAHNVTIRINASGVITVLYKTLLQPGSTLNDFGNGWFTFPPAPITIDASGIVSGILATARGGTGVNSSAATGIAHVAAGAWTFSKIVYADMANETAHTLLGNPTGAGAAPSEITLGAGLTFSGTTLAIGTVSAANGGTGINGATAANGTLLIGNGSGFTLATLTAGANVTITTGAGTITIAASGGGGLTSPLTTKGDIWVYSTTNARFPVASDGYVLSCDSLDPTGLKWIAVPSFHAPVYFDDMWDPAWPIAYGSHTPVVGLASTVTEGAMTVGDGVLFASTLTVATDIFGYYGAIATNTTTTGYSTRVCIEFSGSVANYTSDVLLFLLGYDTGANNAIIVEFQAGLISIRVMTAGVLSNLASGSGPGGPIVPSVHVMNIEYDGTNINANLDGGTFISAPVAGYGYNTQKFGVLIGNNASSSATQSLYVRSVYIEGVPTTITVPAIPVPVWQGGTGQVVPWAALDALTVQSGNIASATITDLTTALGRNVSVDGTTTITNLGDCEAGIERVVTFNGALVLTYNAGSLILPGAANITTAAGDTAYFVSLGGGSWKCITYVPAAVVPASRRYLRTVVAAGATYTPSADCNYIFARLIGGGGGGGGCTSASVSAALGGGGSCGGYLEVSATVTPGTAYTIALGAAGSAGANTGGTGGTGGATTLTIGGTTYTANGGLGGVGQTAGTSLATTLGGASPAISTNGDVNGSGEPGKIGLRLSGTVGMSGAGGSSPFGGGGNAKNAQGAGNAGIGYGAGGGGGCVLNGGGAVVGGVGTVGTVIVHEFS